MTTAVASVTTTMAGVSTTMAHMAATVATMPTVEQTASVGRLTANHRDHRDKQSNNQKFCTTHLLNPPSPLQNNYKSRYD
jgi:hypothetical protein